jgi:hypothetical protein
LDLVLSAANGNEGRGDGLTASGIARDTLLRTGTTDWADRAAWAGRTGLGVRAAGRTGDRATLGGASESARGLGRLAGLACLGDLGSLGGLGSPDDLAELEELAARGESGEVQGRTGSTASQTLDELDVLGELDELDELDELEKLGELDKRDEFGKLDELEKLGELEELDELDELDEIEAPNGLAEPAELEVRTEAVRCDKGRGRDALVVVAVRLWRKAAKRAEEPLAPRGTRALIATDEEEVDWKGGGEKEGVVPRNRTDRKGRRDPMP